MCACAVRRVMSVAGCPACVAARAAVRAVVFVACTVCRSRVVYAVAAVGAVGATLSSLRIVPSSSCAIAPLLSVLPPFRVWVPIELRVLRVLCAMVFQLQRLMPFYTQCDGSRHAS